MLADTIFNYIEIIYIIKDKASNIIRTNNIELYKQIKDLNINNNLLYDKKNNKWYEYKTFNYSENGTNYIVEIYNDITKYKQNFQKNNIKKEN